MTELGHLLVAEALLKRLQWPQEIRPLLYLGAIAPDAHRATIDVSYREVHFRSTKELGHRLVDFLRQHLRPALHSQNWDQVAFFVGYLSHLCGDDIWRQKIRAELESLWQRICGSSRLESNSLRTEFYDECDWVDQQLYQRSSHLVEDVRWQLEQAPVHLTVPPLQLGDIQRWRQQVVDTKLPPANYSVRQPRFLSVDFVLDAMTLAEEEAAAMLEWEYKRPAPAPEKELSEWEARWARQEATLQAAGEEKPAEGSGYFQQ